MNLLIFLVILAIAAAVSLGDLGIGSR